MLCLNEDGISVSNNTLRTWVQIIFVSASTCSPLHGDILEYMSNDTSHLTDRMHTDKRSTCPPAPTSAHIAAKDQKKSHNRDNHDGYSDLPYGSPPWIPPDRVLFDRTHNYEGGVFRRPLPPYGGAQVWRHQHAGQTCNRTRIYDLEGGYLASLAERWHDLARPTNCSGTGVWPAYSINRRPRSYPRE